MTVPRQPRSPERGKVLLWLLVFLLLGLLLLTLYFVRGPLLRALADWWVVDDPLEKAQAIVVLGGDNVMGDRVRHAAELYHTGWAPRVVLTGTSFRTYFNEVTLMEQEATNLGIPREHLVVLPQGGPSTLEEALALRSVLAEHNWRKIIVVTSNYHTRRARRIYHAVYRRHGTQVLMSAAPDSDFNPQRWWLQRSGRALLGLELLKSIQTWWELLESPPPPPAIVCLLAPSAL
jgi:uncharacterized SAM-binding protein YcdF (DUF218 family)